MALVQLAQVSKVYRSLKGSDYVAVRDFSLDIEAGEFFCLLGTSGCGKTTVLNMVAGFETVSAGDIRVGGKPIAGPAADRGVVFQGDDSLYGWLSALGNVEFGMRMRGVPRAEREQKARRYIELVGLKGQDHKHPSELSGGMKQRIQIARVLANEPQMLLMDEPFAALDEQTRMTMGHELLRIWSKTRKTVVFITHSLTEAVYLADEVLVMSARPGRIVDRIAIDLPRPRTYEMMATDTFGKLRERIWQQIRKPDGALS